MNKYYYTIGEVSNLLEIKPYVIRYWETEFPQLRPRKDKSRIRKYDESEILLLKKIKDMLYNQRFTIEGARQKLKADKATGTVKEPVVEVVPKAPERAYTASAQAISPEQINMLHEVRDSLEHIRTQCNKLLRSNK